MTAMAHRLNALNLLPGFSRLCRPTRATQSLKPGDWQMVLTNMHPVMSLISLREQVAQQFLKRDQLVIDPHD